jgi:hypothetical protein
MPLLHVITNNALGLVVGILSISELKVTNETMG